MGPPGVLILKKLSIGAIIRYSTVQYWGIMVHSSPSLVPTHLGLLTSFDTKLDTYKTSNGLFCSLIPRSLILSNAAFFSSPYARMGFINENA